MARFASAAATEGCQGPSESSLAASSSSNRWGLLVAARAGEGRGREREGGEWEVVVVVVGGR